MSWQPLQTVFPVSNPSLISSPDHCFPRVNMLMHFESIFHTYYVLRICIPQHMFNIVSMILHHTEYSATCFVTQHSIHCDSGPDFQCVNTPIFIFPFPTDGHLGCVHVFMPTNHARTKAGARLREDTCRRLEAESLEELRRVTSSPCPFALHCDRANYTFSSRERKFPLFHILSNTWCYETVRALPIWRDW